MNTDGKLICLYGQNAVEVWFIYLFRNKSLLIILCDYLAKDYQDWKICISLYSSTCHNMVILPAS